MPASPAPISVLLVVPNAIVRLGLETPLQSDDRFRVLGLTTSNFERNLPGRQPDLILLHAPTSDEADLKIIDRLRERVPGCPVVVLCDRFDANLLASAMERQIHGFFLDALAADGERFLEALVPIARSHSVSFGPALAPYVQRRLGTSADVGGAGLPSLTPREREVLLRAASGRRDVEIGQELHIQRGTAETHVRNLMLKLGAATRTHLGAIAVRAGLV